MSRMSTGLMRVWFVFSLLWDLAVVGGVYLIWPEEAASPTMFDDLIPTLVHQRETLIINGLAISLIGSGLLLLIGIAAMWIVSGFREKSHG